jgi:hypothetical protein
LQRELIKTRFVRVFRRFLGVERENFRCFIFPRERADKTVENLGVSADLSGPRQIIAGAAGAVVVVFVACARRAGLDALVRNRRIGGEGRFDLRRILTVGVAGGGEFEPAGLARKIEQSAIGFTLAGDVAGGDRGVGELESGVGEIGKPGNFSPNSARTREAFLRSLPDM